MMGYYPNYYCGTGCARVDTICCYGGLKGRPKNADNTEKKLSEGMGLLSYF